MDLETENRIAVILMKEAAELRQQAEQEGVHAYLRKPNVKPNSRFLSATVLGVQQANRAVEVNEMWRVRQKEKELDNRIRLTGRHRGGNSSDRSHTDSINSQRSDGKRHTCTVKSAAASCSSSKRGIQDCYLGDVEGFKDEEIDEFLHSRVKRGRGAVGSRMDETGPYLPTLPDSQGKQSCAGWGSSERWEHRVVLGPEKPSSLKSCESSDEESLHDTRKKAEKVGSSKRHSKKHRSKDKSRDEKKKKKNREDKKCKHHK